MKSDHKNVMTAADGRRRAVIEDVTPCVDDGRFAVKRVAGETLIVECDAFADGHDRLTCLLLTRPDGHREWQESAMQEIGNDRWQGRFTVGAVGRHEYAVEARVDRFRSWRHDLGRREDESDIALHLVDGAVMLRAAAEQAGQPGQGGPDSEGGKSGRSAEAKTLLAAASVLVDESLPVALRRDTALEPALGDLAIRHGSREFAVRSPVLPLDIDDSLAGFSAWYEFFPRSTVLHGDPDAPLGVSTNDDGSSLAHGTLRDAIERLPYIADMGFDVVYLPPIHPIGRIDRKGRNNSLTPDDDDVGVCWAIGAREGGHVAVHPALGSSADFEAFVAAARSHSLEIALDIAFQCAPDHPWVDEHPGWFRQRADGSVQFAENPPKQYQDIYPFDFECDDWQDLWKALRDVFRHWLAAGVRVFRVDNPHTKPYTFWEWVIAEIKRDRPDAIFLAEAFTRPKVMHRLAKVGFTHSYTYFTWRNTREELEEYLLEVSQGEGRDYFRPNFWPNTPDILHETLQHGGLAAAALRVVLASTMSSNYGIYGPVFELGYATPREEGSEEYLDSEKYQLRRWNLDSRDSLAPLIGHLNRIRRDYPALQDTYNASVHVTDNPQLICYSKRPRDMSAAQQTPGNPGEVAEVTRAATTLLVIVNLDPHAAQAGWTTLDLDALGLDPGGDFELFDLLSGETFRWNGPHNFIALDPNRGPAHVCAVRALP